MVDSNLSRNQSFPSLLSEHESTLEQFSLQHLLRMVDVDELMDEPIGLMEEEFETHPLALEAGDCEDSSRLEFPKLLRKIENKIDSEFIFQETYDLSRICKEHKVPKTN